MNDLKRDIRTHTDINVEEESKISKHVIREWRSLIDAELTNSRETHKQLQKLESNYPLFETDKKSLEGKTKQLKNINIPRLFSLHKKKDALATLALTTVADPSQYGVAKLSGSRILEFVEKPKEAPSNLINAGFYIMEPEVIDVIPNGFSMLEKDVFPKLAEQGRLREYPTAGQWFDVGNFERYEIAKKKWTGVNPYEEIE